VCLFCFLLTASVDFRTVPRSATAWFQIDGRERATLWAGYETTQMENMAHNPKGLLGLVLFTVFLLGKGAIVCHDSMTVAGIIDFATVADQGSGYGVTSVTHPQMWLSL